MINLVIADDHKLVLEGLQLMLDEEKEINIVGFAHNGKEALEIIAKSSVDILLLDLNMPIMNGLEVCKVLKKKQSDVKIIILSMMDEVKLIQKLIEHGASGYLLKNSGKEEILNAIKKVDNGEKYFEKDVLMQLLSNGNSSTKRKSLMPKISKREKEILKLIMDELTSLEIGQKLFISLGTVETHRRNLINKLGVRNTAGLVRKAIDYNLV
jgi:DNA-binding NarL/FixJ family response regulator